MMALLLKLWFSYIIFAMTVGLLMDLGPFKFRIPGYLIGWTGVIPTPFFALYAIWELF